MPTFDFTKVWESLKDEIIQLAKTNFSQQDLQAALDDGKKFLDNNKNKLEQYLTQLNNHEIDEAEFKDLVGGLKALAQMTALHQAGVQAAKIQKFTTRAIDLLIGAAFKSIPI